MVKGMLRFGICQDVSGSSLPRWTPSLLGRAPHATCARKFVATEVFLPAGDAESSHAAALTGRAPAPQVHFMPRLLLLHALLWVP